MRRVTAILLLLFSGIELAAAGPDLEDDRVENRINNEYSLEPVGEPYLLAVVAKLAEASTEVAGLNLRPRVIRSSAPMVIVLGNGALFVSTGLLARMQNDSQVASLLATEIAESYLGEQPQYKDKPATSARNAFGKIFLVTVTAGLAIYPLMKGEEKAQSDEMSAFNREADTLGLTWTDAAGWDASEGETAMQRLLLTWTCQIFCVLRRVDFSSSD